MGCTQRHCVKALIISALLVLVAWLRWKANTGSPPLPERDPDYWGRVSPRAQRRGSPFLEAAPTQWSVRPFNNLAPHLQSFHLLDKGADRATTPKKPYSTCFIFCFVFWTIPFRETLWREQNKKKCQVTSRWNIEVQCRAKVVTMFSPLKKYKTLKNQEKVLNSC